MNLSQRPDIIVSGAGCGPGAVYETSTVIHLKLHCSHLKMMLSQCIYSHGKGLDLQISIGDGMDLIKNVHTYVSVTLIYSQFLFFNTPPPKKKNNNPILIKRTPKNSFLDISELAELGQADGPILGNKYEAAEMRCYIKVSLYVTLFACLLGNLEQLLFKMK